MTTSEMNLLLKLTPSLTQHHKDNPDSLIAKIFGIFTVKAAKMGEVHIMLMENTLNIRE